MTPGELAIVAPISAGIGAVAREIFKYGIKKILRMDEPTVSVSVTAPPVNAVPGGTNGISSSYRREVKEVFEDTLKADVLPILENQTRILQSMGDSQKDIRDGILKLGALYEAAPGRKKR